MSENKKDKVVSSALSIFLKYGYKRVTMADLADAAEISRPALYLLFDKKEDIFKAVIRRASDKHLQKINAQLPSAKAPRDKINLIFEIWIIESFDAIQRSEEARELLESGFEFAKDVVEENYTTLQSLLTPVIEQFPKESLPKGFSHKEIANILANSVRGFKQICKSSSELRDMIEKLVGMILKV